MPVMKPLTAGVPNGVATWPLAPNVVSRHAGGVKRAMPKAALPAEVGGAADDQVRALEDERLAGVVATRDPGACDAAGAEAAERAGRRDARDQHLAVRRDGCVDRFAGDVERRRRAVAELDRVEVHARDRQRPGVARAG